MRGAEWATTAKNLHIPNDSPKRAAWCAVIPGIGAVYNRQYMKALTFFAVFAALMVMGDNVDGVFGFGAFVFLIYTMFDAYRTAEAYKRAQVEGNLQPEDLTKDKPKSVMGWGLVLISLGFILLLKNYIHFYFLQRAWPLAFIILGGYLVYAAIKRREREADSAGLLEKKEF
jgi:hypothetical protein